MPRFAGIPVDSTASIEPRKPRFGGIPVDGAQPGAASAPAPAAPARQPTMIPEYDAMGNPTGGMLEVPAGPQMGYGEQMGNVLGAIDNGVRMLANGATFNLADRLAGGMSAVTGGAGSYDEGVTAERARTQKIRDDHPYLGGAMELGGGLLGGAGMVKGGVTLAGKMGEALVPRIVGFGAEGAAYGAAHGAGNTYSDKASDYADAAETGAKWGGGLGAGLPVLGAMGAGLYRAGSAAIGRPVQDAGRVASTLMKGAAQADEAGLRRLPEMGPEAMLVDAGPSMLGLGQGAGTGIGAGRSALVDALRSRDAGTGARLASTLDEALGPAPIPSRIRAGLDESRERIGAQYGQLPLRNPVDTEELAGALDEMSVRLRGPAQAAVQRVRGYLNETRLPGSPQPRDAQGRPTTPLAGEADTLFQTRQAIDGLLAGEADPKVIRQLTIARQSVDELLDHAVPGLKEVDGRFQEVARQDGGLTRGGMIFGSGKTAIHPAELVDELRAGVIPENRMVGPSATTHRMQQGARAEIDRLVGTNVNDLNTLERTLATPQDWNSQKFAAVFSEPQRETVADALGLNRKFRQSYQDIVQNSQTAQRSAAQKALDAETSIPIDTTATGMAVGAMRAIAEALMKGARDTTKDEVGQLLAKKGPEAVKIMRALLESAESARTGAATTRRAVGNPAFLGGGGQLGGGRR